MVRTMVTTDRYVASARTLSFALLVLAYLSVDSAVFNGRRSVLLRQARHSFASHYVLVKMDSNVDPTENVPRFEDALANLGLIRTYPVENPFYIGVSLYPFDVPDSPLSRQAKNTALWSVEVTLPTYPVVNKDTWLQSLQWVGQKVGVDTNPSDSYMLYAGIENALMRRQIKVPGLGLFFTSYAAVLIMGFLTFVSILSVRNRLTYVFKDETLGASEPWMLLDASFPLERIISNLWLCFIAISPWLIGGCVLFSSSNRIRFIGSTTAIASDVLVFSCIVIIMILGGRASIGAVIMLFELRKQRQKPARS